MPICDSAKLVRDAYKKGYAVAQVNTNGGTYDLVRAIAEVAEEERAPIIFGAYEANLEYRGFEYAALAMRYFAERMGVPAAIHLDHGSNVEVCRQAIACGFTSIMLDGSHLPVDENISQMKEVSAIARAAGVSIEAEVGELQKLNPDGSMNEVKNLTDPGDVAKICSATDIDMLAVGIGNAHGFYKGQPDIRLDLLAELSKVSTVPLVLHGTTGLADKMIKQCISLGMAKVNLGTLIRTRYVEYTAETIATGEHKNHPWRVSQKVLERIKEDVRYIVRLTGSTGKAGEIE